MIASAVDQMQIAMGCRQLPLQSLQLPPAHGILSSPDRSTDDTQTAPSISCVDTGGIMSCSNGNHPLTTCLNIGGIISCM